MNPTDSLIKSSIFAQILGVTPQLISIWKKTIPDFAAVYDGDLINLPRACKYLYQRAKEAEDTSSSDASEEKKRWDAIKAEIQARQLMGELVPKSPYIQTELKRFSIIKDAILTMPERLATDLSLNEDQKRQVLNVARSILNQVHDTFNSQLDDWLTLIDSQNPLNTVHAAESKEP